jgi:hypothetical protein
VITTLNVHFKKAKQWTVSNAFPAQDFISTSDTTCSLAVADMNYATLDFSQITFEKSVVIVHFNYFWNFGVFSG